MPVNYMDPLCPTCGRPSPPYKGETLGLGAERERHPLLLSCDNFIARDYCINLLTGTGSYWLADNSTPSLQKGRTNLAVKQVEKTEAKGFPGDKSLSAPIGGRFTSCPGVSLPLT